jgi:hypothetical protein
MLKIGQRLVLTKGVVLPTPAVRIRKARTGFKGRQRIHLARLVVLMTAVILRVAQRMYRSGLLGLAGIENVVRFSGKLRRFGWRLLGSKSGS